ncbi:helix-turn-helix family protein [[Clostridium] bifermentans ATCC 638]|uniref:Helix-turn-helix family protein n=1 Tax=Paraclostridium bifermentans ATCC 638 = DSM 14991 TaxID=1233171 RepID=T4V8T1_PARBF|nr:helix-turn-helix transcriptional regulator [Paraclostridium bifermentans]EQK40114.1 helix-turn-helix family protein [[Clostridium] bifermentans ATCC 638] [Paraclostridium bifermentans ATCC 638 = DSM 14991]RIZ57349.1 XRE family transcriptional regulator [Paraclostridium bifermentans]UAG20054.1 helix-turn-helix domain-containing protein [Paraclostridium bifermentans]
MTNKIDIEQQIKSLQEHLHSIRKIAGWTAEDLGNRIGVTKQTISNIENNKVRLTQTQYIAIRSVLEYEIKENPENIVLQQVITLLLDNENCDSKKEEEIKKVVETIAATASGGIRGAQLAALAGALLGPIGAIGAVGVGIGGVARVAGVAGAALGWLSPFMVNKKIKKENQKKDK